MKIIAVDDEHYALTGLKSAIEEALPKSTISCFNDCEAALEYAKANRIDIAFLDIEMSGMNGLQLAKILKEIYGKTYIVFVTGHSQYAINAFELDARGYIMKPFRSESIIKVIKNLQTESTLVSERPLAARLRVQTFGSFEVFLDNKPLKFSRSKTKELFAYLVSRKGAKCNKNEITAVLWENKADSESLQSMLRVLVKDLTQTLGKAEMKDIVIKERGYLAIAPDKISCDFYDFCKGLNVNRYMGEFMKQYSWAEFTNSYLEEMYKKTKIT